MKHTKQEFIDFYTMLHETNQFSELFESISYDENTGERVHFSLGCSRVRTEARHKRIALRGNCNSGQVMDDHEIKEIMIDGIFGLHVQEIADWLYETDEKYYTVTETLTGFRNGIYYDGNGDRHITHEFYLELARCDSAEYGIAYGFLGIIIPD